jgi:hypothetical protein
MGGWVVVGGGVESVVLEPHAEKATAATATATKGSKAGLIMRIVLAVKKVVDGEQKSLTHRKTSVKRTRRAPRTI